MTVVLISKRDQQISELVTLAGLKHKPSWQGFRSPQNQGNAHLNLENSSVKKCPKSFGQGFRPPPPLRAMPK